VEMARVFVATSSPAGFPLGRWSQVSATMWEERKLQNPKTAYQFEVVNGPDAGQTATVRLKLQGQSTEVLITEMTAQIFVDGCYFGEYIGQWQMQNGAPAPAPACEQAPPPVAARGGRPQRGAPMEQPPAAPFGQKAGPPPRDDYGAPQKAAPPGRGGRGAPPAPARDEDFGPLPGAYDQPPPVAQKAGRPGAYGGPPGAPMQQKAGPPPAYGAPPAAQKAAPGGYAPPADYGNVARGAPPRPEKQSTDRDPKSVQRLCDAARSGDVGSLKSMLQSVDPDAAGRDGKTPLLIAAGMGHVDIVQALLDAGADPNIGKDGNTPMTAAFQKGNQEILRLLFQASFATLDNAVLPEATQDYSYQQAAAYGDEDVPETALMELREVTAKLASMSTIPQAAKYQAAEDHSWLPESEDADKIREEAIKEAMRNIAKQQKEGM